MGRELKPWERREGEGPERWEAFSRYRDLGLSRDVPTVASELSKSASLLYRWLSEEDWNSRAEAWDREQDRIRLEAQERAISKTVEKEFSNKELTRDWLMTRWRKIADLALVDPVHDEDGNIIATKPNYYGALRSTELIAKSIGVLSDKQAGESTTNNYATFIQMIKGLPDEEEQPAIEIEKD